MTDPIMMIFWAAVIATVSLSAGVCWGVKVAEGHAVLHSDCATAHHMGGGFYYIVPESEYVELIQLRHRAAYRSDPEEE